MPTRIETQGREGGEGPRHTALTWRAARAARRTGGTALGWVLRALSLVAAPGPGLGPGLQPAGPVPASHGLPWG
jgi:hypothetical protein